MKTEIAHARQKELDENRHVLFPISIVPFETIRTWKDFDADTGKDSARDIREHYIPDFSDWKEGRPSASGKMNSRVVRTQSRSAFSGKYL